MGFEAETRLELVCAFSVYKTSVTNVDSLLQTTKLCGIRFTQNYSVKYVVDNWTLSRRLDNIKIYPVKPTLIVFQNTLAD